MSNFIIDDDNYLAHLAATESHGFSRGLIPRDYSACPVGYQSFAPSFPDNMLIDKDEWAERLAEQKAKKARIGDITKDIPVLDQNGRGDCWAFSSVRAVMLLRAMANEPYVPLCGTAVAYIIKPRSQGGWNSESLEWIVKNGVPSQELWPQGQTGRSYDTPEMRADAAKRKVTEWWDGSDDREKARHQMISALLTGLPCVTDFNWWGHSVCTHSLESLDESIIDNSWGSSWGSNGRGNLRGSKMIPDGLVIPRVTMAS